MQKNRRNFLLAGLGLTSLWALFKSNPKKPSRGSAKFLTHDGKLVEVDLDHLPPSAWVAGKEDIQKWIQPKKQS